MRRGLTILLYCVVVAVCGTIGALLYLHFAGHSDSSESSVVPRDALAASHHETAELADERRAEGKALRRIERAQAKRKRPNKKELAPVNKGASPIQEEAGPDGSADLRASFSELESAVGGEVGVAFAPLGSTESPVAYGLEGGHAWSTFKVPLTATLIKAQDESFSEEEEELAASAITASDNEAAAELFSDLEGVTGGGLSGASEAIQALLEATGGATEVATAPPPSGAVSTWGQTQWTLSESVAFYGALACGQVLSPQNTRKLLDDMNHVIPEQQWGLGQADFSHGTQVAIKAGWGPDAAEGGAYLVRQAGIISSPGGGAVVTIAAQDSSGSFEAGVSDLDQVADWVAQQVPLEGSC